MRQQLFGLDQAPADGKDGLAASAFGLQDIPRDGLNGALCWGGSPDGLLESLGDIKPAHSPTPSPRNSATKAR